MMNETEWQTYLTLEYAGPRPGSSTSPPPPAPPWKNGEVSSGVLPQTADPGVIALRTLLDKRRSASELWHPLESTALIQVLSLALTRPAQAPHRRYPTSGGCDELGMLIVARNVSGLDEGAYWAASENGAFSFAAPLDDNYAAFERRVCPFLGLTPAYSPAALLLILADWRRLAARYTNCLLASALWDAGTLLQTLHLAATAYEINACICACIQPRLIEAWLNLDCQEVGQVGLIALSGRR
jgi:SagB-type dehydrogenase family enzyme